MLSPGNHHDAPEGVRLLQEFGKHFNNGYMIMDRAYEGKEVRDAVEEQGLTSVVPPKKNRKEPWQYDTTKYKKRNCIERLFRRIKQYRKVYTRYDKLDIMYSSFVYLALIFELLR